MLTGWQFSYLPSLSYFWEIRSRIVMVFILVRYLSTTLAKSLISLKAVFHQVLSLCLHWATCFLSVVFKDSVFFKSIISCDCSISQNGFDCIPKWFTTLFCCYFPKIRFLAYLVMLLHLFFHFYRPRSFPQKATISF